LLHCDIVLRNPLSQAWLYFRHYFEEKKIIQQIDTVTVILSLIKQISMDTIITSIIINDHL
jgi:hypothetical protein